MNGEDLRKQFYEMETSVDKLMDHVMTGDVRRLDENTLKIVESFQNTLEQTMEYLKRDMLVKVEILERLERIENGVDIVKKK